ncbi:hypothetical protein ACH4SP_23730 [Streptomyces sp. NPDC021093]|uniref:hypothetical protein n=1 Tax=Streptomyces sp. NPDC021093 TaxID=3365112 RepID=UPI0037A062A8
MFVTQLKVAQAALGAVSLGVVLAVCAPTGAVAAPVTSVAPVTPVTSVAAPQAAESVQAVSAVAARHGVGGRVTSRTGQIVRSHPTTHSANIGSYRAHAIVRIACKVRGQNVGGNSIWFKLWDRSGWMSAKYVDNFSYVGWCGHHRAATSALTPAELAAPASPADPAGPKG